MSLDRCKAETTSTQFVMWMEWMKRQYNKNKPLYYWLAKLRQDLFEVKHLLVKNNPPKSNIDEFFVKFDLDFKEVDENSEEHQKYLADKLALHKAAFEVWTGKKAVKE